MYLVEGKESGELGTFETIAEAKKAIKRAKKFDIEELGYTDEFEIYEVDE